MRHGMLFILALIAGAVMHSNTAAAADVRTEQITNQLSSPMASYVKNPAFDYSARKVLGYASEARVALEDGRKEEAAAYVDAAQHELDAIRDTRNYLEMMGLPFGRVLYGENGSYYIPIADDTYAVRTYAHGPFWSAHKATAVRDVELVTVDVAVSPEKATGYLQAAQKDIGGNQYKKADKELKGLLDDSIHPTIATSQPFARLQDNIYLTRILIRQENYAGARYTLRHARAALDDYEKTITTAENRPSIDNLRQEIDALDDIIQQNNPTLLSTASRKVDQWWRDLKSWAHEKTSRSEPVMDQPEILDAEEGTVISGHLIS